MLSAIGSQSFEEKLYAFKYFIAGQEMSFVILKATTSEILGPKKKHLNYLVGLTNEPNVSIPRLVKYLMRRLNNPEWTVTFKVMITIHYLSIYGNEKFIQNLASSTEHNRYFDYLASFIDCTSAQAFDMSTFVRRYSHYVRVKIQTYRLLGTDFCHVDHNSPKKMVDKSAEQLMAAIPILQEQFDALLAFDPLPRDLNNGVINCAFSILYKDFVKLYIAYQVAIIRLIELYFSTGQVKRAKQLLEAYKKFLVRMDKVCDFIRVLDSVGIDKSDMPSFSRVPNLPLKSFEDHLNQLKAAAIKRSNYQALGEIRSVELPRIECGTLGRRRSLRSQQSTPQHERLTDIFLSPIATRNQSTTPGRSNALCELVEEFDATSRNSPGDQDVKSNDRQDETATKKRDIFLPDSDSTSTTKLLTTDKSDESSIGYTQLGGNQGIQTNNNNGDVSVRASDNDRDLLLWFDSISSEPKDSCSVDKEWARKGAKLPVNCIDR